MRSQIKLFSVFRLGLIAAILLLVSLSFSAYAAIETHSFATAVERKRYQSFIEEMRCPKCQNQNLAGSDSPISADLRREIYQMIEAEKSDQEIVNYMVARYGDFILYRPRVTPATYVLWIAPIVLLIGGIVILLVMLRKRRQLALTQTDTMLTAEQQQRLSSLLADKKNDNSARSADSANSAVDVAKTGEKKPRASRKKPAKNNEKSNQEPQ